MATYRYYAADILTGNVLAELPLYGVWMSRRLSTTGDFTGAFKLGSEQHNDEELLLGTDPGKTAVYVERDNTLIWGGILWSRTYQGSTRVAQITAQTFESVFDHIALESNVIQQDVDQFQIFKYLIDSMQLQANNNFGIDTSLIGTCGVERTLLIPGYEYHYVKEGIDQLVPIENGFDYTIDILASNIPDHPQKVVRVGYPILGSGEATSSLTFDFPGNIADYWWPESGSRGGSRFVALGQGAGEAMLIAQADASDLLSIGYPAWWIVNAYKEISDQTVLTQKIAADRDRLKIPVNVPTFDLKTDRVPDFTGWNNLGDTVIAHIEDPRFPNGKDIRSRMIGWELQIGDSDNTEMVKLAIQGEDQGDA